MLKRLGRLFMLVALAGVTLGQDAFKPRDANEETAWSIYQAYKASAAREAQLRGALAQRRKDTQIVQGSVGSVLAVPPEDRAEMIRWQRELDEEVALQQTLLQIWNNRFRGRYGEMEDIHQTIYDPATKRTMDRIEFRLRNFPFNPKAAGTTGTPSTSNSKGNWTLSTTQLWSDNPEMDRLIQEYRNGTTKVTGSISAGESVHQWVNPSRPNSPKTLLAVTWDAPPAAMKPGDKVVIRAHAVDRGSDSGAGDGDFVSFNTSIWATNDEKSWIQIPGGGRDLYAFPRKSETKEYSFAMPAKEFRRVILRISTGNSFWGKYFDYIYEWN